MRRMRIPSSPLRNVGLGLLALAAVLLPDGVFAAAAGAPWEITVLRLLSLVGISLVAGLTWVRGASVEARRRLRRWSIPGLVALAIYLLAAQPLYLFLGFCLLSAASVDMWTTRAHIASETLRVRVMARRAHPDS